MKWIKIALSCIVVLIILGIIIYFRPYQWKVWVYTDSSAILSKDGELEELPIFRSKSMEFLLVYGTEPYPYIIDYSGKRQDRVYISAYRRMYKLGNLLIQRQYPLIAVPPGKADYLPSIVESSDFLSFTLVDGENTIKIPKLLLTKCDGSHSEKQ